MLSILSAFFMVFIFMLGLPKWLSEPLTCVLSFLIILSSSVVLCLTYFRDTDHQPLPSEHGQSGSISVSLPRQQPFNVSLSYTFRYFLSQWNRMEYRVLGQALFQQVDFLNTTYQTQWLNTRISNSFHWMSKIKHSL